MYPHRSYFTFVAATLLLSVSSQIAFSVPVQVNKNTIVKNNYAEFAQVSPNNKQSEVRRLNEEGIKISNANNFTEALQILQKALAIAKNIDVSEGLVPLEEARFLEAATLNNIGRVYQKQGHDSSALNYYLQALAINKELSISENTPGQAHIAFGKTYSNLGFLFEKQNKTQLAIFFYKHCVNNREKVRLNPKAFSTQQIQAYSLTVSQTYRALGEALLKGERVIEAQRIMDLVKVEELEEYFNNVPGNQRTAKGIELLTSEKPIKQKLDTTLDNAVVLGKELTALRKIPPQKRSPQQKQRIEQLVAAQQELLEEFNKFITSSSIQSQVEQISRTARRQNLDLESLNEIRDNLGRLSQKSVLLYPLVLKDSLEIILVTPDSPPIHRTVAVKKEQLNKTIVDFRQALENPSKDVKKPARQLYDWLIKPIEKDLNQTGTKTLIYAPDDQLRYIPLAALYDGKQWLVQRFSVNHITAASLTNFNIPPESKLRILAGAFTKGSYQIQVGNRSVAFSGLPFAAREVQNLANTVPGTKQLLDGAFSPEATVPQMDDYTIVHLATHAAFVVGKPEDSFILFGNGDRVNLREVATWSLPRVDLVVLSACETGLGGKLGNGEEILGFGYQIQKTGARSAIASLWAVDDGGTQTLMSVFYDLLPGGKLTKAEALRQAQIALITGNLPVSGKNIPAIVDGNFNHPYYWAPFILIGNGL
jgi:CHAT domain-containing protein